jgi:hypothetical protein
VTLLVHVDHCGDNSRYRPQGADTGHEHGAGSRDARVPGNSSTEPSPPAHYHARQRATPWTYSRLVKHAALQINCHTSAAGCKARPSQPGQGTDGPLAWTVRLTVATTLKQTGLVDPVGTGCQSSDSEVVRRRGRSHDNCTARYITSGGTVVQKGTKAYQYRQHACLIPPLSSKSLPSTYCSGLSQFTATGSPRLLPHIIQGNCIQMTGIHTMLSQRSVVS